MSVKIKYKNTEIANIDTTSNKTLKTKGKYCEDDFIIENTQDGGGGGTPTELYVTHDGTYTNANGYSPVTVDSERLSYNLGAHTDENGIWHKPDDWDDIESMDITDKHEAYILCGTKLNPYPFVRLRVYGQGAITWSYGHVSNGVYTIHEDSTTTSIGSGKFIELDMQNIEDEYIVIRIQSTGALQQVVTASWNATTDLPYAFGSTYNCVLMAYMRLYRGSNMSFSSMYVESIKHIDWGKYYEGLTTDYTIGLSSAFNGDINLQRLEILGTDFTKLKISSFSSMFYNCYALSYLSTVEGKNIFDLSGADTSACTSFGTMFSNCWCLTSKIILRNFDVSKVTTFSNMFGNCRSLKTIEGIETWSKAPLCTTVNSMFYYCYNLKGTIDLSSLYLGNGTSALKDFSSVFYYTISLEKVILNNTNLSKVTTMATLFYYSSIKEIVMETNFTPPTSLCTTFSSMIYYCGVEEFDISGWNFNGSTGLNLNQLFYACYALRKITANNMPDWTRTSAWSDTSSSSGLIRYCYNLETADLSWFDISICNGTYMHINFKDNPRLTNFYPPQNIYKNFNINALYLLTSDSLNRVIANLKTVTTKTTLTLGAINKAKLTDEEIAVATSKGWTVSA